jgi:thiamine-phosphate pyrophosphorylase
MKKLDLSVYVLTDAVPALDRTHEDIAWAAIQGGASMIQFRDKTMSDRQFAETAARILGMARAAGIPLIVNDRISIAVAIGADGVHIGRNDGDAGEIQRALPPQMIFGLSAINYDEALQMDALRASYLGVGPVFPTASKEDATPPIGIEMLHRICRIAQTPVVAIGGINCATLPSVFHAGAAGGALISAVTHARDMTVAVRELKSIAESGAEFCDDCF